MKLYLSIKSILTKCNTQLLITFIFISSLLVSFNAKGQDIVHQFGQQTKCVVDSTTIQLFLTSLVENEGMNFIINNDGKTCSSGKSTHPDDYTHMIDQLDKLKSDNLISTLICNQVKCNLEKNKLIKEYINSNPLTVDQEKINSILNDHKCN